MEAFVVELAVNHLDVVVHHCVNFINKCRAIWDSSRLLFYLLDDPVFLLKISIFYLCNIDESLLNFLLKVLHVVRLEASKAGLDHLEAL